MLHEIEHSAGVVEQLTNGDSTVDVRITIQPRVDRIIQFESAFMRKVKDEGCQVIFTDTAMSKSISGVTGVSVVGSDIPLTPVQMG